MNKDKTLCGTCRHLIRAKFGATEKVRCWSLEINLTRYAKSCTSYRLRDEPTMQDMYAMAWILTKEKNIGFERTESKFVRPTEQQANGSPALVPYRE